MSSSTRCLATAGLISAGLLALSALLSTPALPARAQEETPYVTLAGRAVLPADTFAPGPPTGRSIDRPILNRVGPFPSPPVQGISAVLPLWQDRYLVLSDNGFGNKNNSPDYRLRWYDVRPDFATGSVEVGGFTELSDPAGLVPFPITNVTGDRVLTGGDFDPESFRMAPDGTFWVGEEFGPYLLHFDASGRLLDPPIPTPYPAELEPFAKGLRFVQSPDHPDFAGLNTADARRAAANLATSKGFEGMALSADESRLYMLLEGPLVDDPIQTRLLIQEFDLASKQYTGNYWFYPLSAPGQAIGEMTAIDDQRFLVIERDGEQGAKAQFKRIFLIDLRDKGADQVVTKRLVVDLLAITDSQGLTEPEEGAVGLGPVFSFPFVTIESVWPLGDRTLLVINDNNYPFSNGRRPDLAPDDTEFILVTLDEAL